MHNYCLSLLSILTSVLLAGCVFNNTGALEPLERDPDITGEITQIKEGKVYNSILVEEKPGVYYPSESAGNKIWFTLTNETEILIQQKDGSLSASNFDTLAIGRIVKGWIKGFSTDSIPAQGAAQRIVVVQE